MEVVGVYFYKGLDIWIKLQFKIYQQFPLPASAQLQTQEEEIQKVNMITFVLIQ